MGGIFWHFWVTDKWYRISILATSRTVLFAYTYLNLSTVRQYRSSSFLVQTHHCSNIFQCESQRHGNARMRHLKCFQYKLSALFIAALLTQPRQWVRLCSQQASHIAEAKFNKAHRGKTTVTMHSLTIVSVLNLHTDTSYSEHASTTICR